MIQNNTLEMLETPQNVFSRNIFYIVFIINILKIIDQ